MPTRGVPHGKRTELSFIEFMENEHSPDDPLEYSLVRFNQQHAIHTAVTRRWWNHYLLWGETLSETKQKLKKINKLAYKNKATSVVTATIIATLKQIIDEKPELYLDEIADKLVEERNCYLSMSTISRVLKNQVGYSLQVCYEIARQRDEVERMRYKEALRVLVNDVAELVFIDETHKDRNAGRRRRVWGVRNSGGMGINRWFRMNVRYSLIAAMDINGFIPTTLDIVRRDEISEEGAAGTVDSAYFEGWVETCLVPTLGRYELGERRSIVVMDNASTHMNDRVKQLINGAGAYLLYTAPYSPDLNPIELAFKNYKTSLKRDYELGEVDWYQAHLNAIDSVDRDVCIKEYRKCGVPLSNELLTSEEEEEKKKNELLLLLSCLCTTNAIIMRNRS